jgi:VWFA-related protein
MRKNCFAHLALLAPLACAQAPTTAPGPEVTTQDTPITFQSKVNLVLVPVVVRDRNGKLAAGLRQEDFQLFDKGKPQVISKFSVEMAAGTRIPIAPQVEQTPEEKELGVNASGLVAPGIVAPDHFIAYLFDDVHLDFADLARARAAADLHFTTALKETDRAAIYTTSGQTVLDFTDDRVQLHDALQQLRPHPIARSSTQDCPDISYYMADLIQNKNDPAALNIAAQETILCMNSSNMTLTQAQQIAQTAAQFVLSSGQQESRVAMSVLKQLVDRMSAAPGQRMITLVSPGFLRLDEQIPDETEIMDRAIRANVTINALDARGLYTDTPDISKRGVDVNLDRVKQQYDRDAARASADILAELADGTGGAFFQNNNDLSAGFNELSTTPAVYYVLGFAPQNLKLDGSYHALKVSIKTPPGLSAKARRGYYAPRHLSDADEDAKEEIRQAMYSREEMHDIPVDLHTQFFKASESEARLAVQARIDVRKLRFRKADGLNANEVLVVSALFDRNGNFVQGVSKTLKMRLKDDTLTNKLNSGVNIRSDFKIAPGTYVIRLVVRDAEGQLMAAQNGAVEIP